MSEESRKDPVGNEERHTREQELEEKLAHVHSKEEKLEHELDRLEEELEHEEKLEHEISRELDESRHHHHKQFFLIFIINGEDYRVEVDPDSLLKTAVENALKASGNTGRREA